MYIIVNSHSPGWHACAPLIPLPIWRSFLILLQIGALKVIFFTRSPPTVLDPSLRDNDSFVCVCSKGNAIVFQFSVYLGSGYRDQDCRQNGINQLIN